tara:strand:- start:59 stop:256 length:198 start_codon:yes stop_codon:yes gene_type:complete
METLAPPPETKRKTKAVLIHLSPMDYQRTIKAADECGLQTGPWLRMHLLQILKAQEKERNQEAGT